MYNRLLEFGIPVPRHVVVNRDNKVIPWAPTATTEEEFEETEARTFGGRKNSFHGCKTPYPMVEALWLHGKALTRQRNAWFAQC